MHGELGRRYARLDLPTDHPADLATTSIDAAPALPGAIMTGRYIVGLVLGLAIAVPLNIAIAFVPKLWVRQTIRFSILALCVLIAALIASRT